MHAYLSNANHVISKDDPKFLSSMKAVGLCWQPREEKVRSEDTKTAMVHTGMWGCGSFKGLWESSILLRFPPFSPWVWSTGSLASDSHCSWPLPCPVSYHYPWHTVTSYTSPFCLGILSITQVKERMGEETQWNGYITMMPRWRRGEGSVGKEKKLVQGQQSQGSSSIGVEARNAQSPSLSSCNRPFCPPSTSTCSLVHRNYRVWETHIHAYYIHTYSPVFLVKLHPSATLSSYFLCLRLETILSTTLPFWSSSRCRTTSASCCSPHSTLRFYFFS